MSSTRMAYIGLLVLLISMTIWLVFGKNREGMSDCSIGSLLDPETLRLSQTLDPHSSHAKKSHTGVSINLTISKANAPASRVTNPTGVTPLSS